MVLAIEILSDQDQVSHDMEKIIKTKTVKAVFQLVSSKHCQTPTKLQSQVTTVGEHFLSR